jgi:NADH-quinone oxidoreductase subunit J
MNIFFIISTIATLLATQMVYLKSPINATLSLCTILFLSTCLLFLSYVEFLSYIFIMVYVGGIMLLFLFVIIMLNLKADYNNKKKSFRLLSGPTVVALIILKLQSFLTLYITQN